VFLQKRDLRSPPSQVSQQAVHGDARPEHEQHYRTRVTKVTRQPLARVAVRLTQDYSNYPYLEVYSDQNGRIVLELEPGQVQVIGTPIPASESEPVSREEQNRNMAEFLVQMAREVRL
jgi:hypothetical protein